MPLKLDVDLQPDQISRITSPDAIGSFFHDLGYPTGRRQTLAASGLSLGETERNATNIEVLSEKAVFVRLKSVTAKARAELVRAFGKDVKSDYLLVLTSDFDSLEFVLIDKQQSKKLGTTAPTARPLVFVVPRRWPQQCLRILRRLTFTMDDGLRQFDKLRSVFDAAHFSGSHFTNRALFADHFLDNRLKDNPAWKADPGPAFQSIRRYIDSAPDRLANKPAADIRREFFDPLWSVLGFRATAITRKPDEIQPDYRLADSANQPRTVVLAYPWQRWLDGPDPNDPDRPAENPGAAVVSLLERGDAEWAIVTNGKLWRLYSRAAHSRSTNFYEVDLQDAFVTSGLTDPNDAFRYWWLFFRAEAFAPSPATPASPESKSVWLDSVAQGSREYAREVEVELKRRVFYDVVPMLAQGFLHDRRSRLKKSAKPTDEELEQIRAGTLTLLYRILFLLYAESRDLLPVREAAYYGLSLKRMKEEIREAAGVAQSEADTKLDAAFSKLKADLYDRLANPKSGLFAAMAGGSRAANVPKYNGGLFRLDPAEAADEREAQITSFLNDHKVPDYYLAAAIDRLARVEDPRDTHLKFVDYKSLGVRQLGSIYEGLLEFKLTLADEDLAIKESKSATIGEYIPLSKARGKSSKKSVRLIKKGDPILSRDNAERKATGSYYTPDHIVQYIVENTVGPVLKRKTEALRPDFRKAEKDFHRHFENAKSDPRILLGHASAASLRFRRTTDPAAKPTETDFRAFALAQTYEGHKDLVEKLFDLKVLDPAMGSGHFLVEAVDFITDELLDFLNAFPNNPVSAALDRTREAILESLGDQGIEVDESFRRQLTDIHLLKRHVLKRCIYGVDLNPLATELAKVSLWLDAFTLGAPLSFLDHHLRTGNSLIGSSLPELEDAIHDSLFKIDESHLLRAVQNVLVVARLADATASEVAKSKQAFDEARKTLSGYGVLLDILVAKHFGHSAATSILSMGRDLKLESRDAFFKSLGRLDKELVTNVASLANEQRFFHWDLEFPEVFYTFAGMADGRIERRSSGTSGFDAVIGNPPYGPLPESARPFAFKFYRCSDGKPDIYGYFFERAFLLLSYRGSFAFIAPNTWLTLKAFASLRRLILKRGNIRSILDTLSVFEEALVDTAVVVVESPRSPGAMPAQVSIPVRAANPVEQLDLIKRKQWAVNYECSQEQWEAGESSAIQYQLDPVSRQWLGSISSACVLLDSCFDVTTGFQIYHNSIHSKKQIADRVFHSLQAKSGWHKCFGGTDVSAFCFTQASHEWCTLESAYRVPDLRFFRDHRVLVQEILGRGRYKVNACYAGESIFYDKSCLGIVTKRPSDSSPDVMKALAAVTNSLLVSWQLVVAGDKGYASGDFARITRGDLGGLWIPPLCRSSSPTSFSPAKLLNAPDPDSKLTSGEITFVLARLYDFVHDIEKKRKPVDRKRGLDQRSEEARRAIDGLLAHHVGLAQDSIAQMASRLEKARSKAANTESRDSRDEVLAE